MAAESHNVNVFDMPHDRLERWGAGERVSARKLNQPVSAIERMRGTRQPRQVVEVRGGTTETETKVYTRITNICLVTGFSTWHNVSGLSIVTCEPLVDESEPQYLEFTGEIVRLGEEEMQAFRWPGVSAMTYQAIMVPFETLPPVGEPVDQTKLCSFYLLQTPGYQYVRWLDIVPYFVEPR